MILSTLKQNQPVMAQHEANGHTIHRPSISHIFCLNHPKRIRLHLLLLPHWKSFPLAIRYDKWDQNPSAYLLLQYRLGL